MAFTLMFISFLAVTVLAEIDFLRESGKAANIKSVFKFRNCLRKWPFPTILVLTCSLAIYETWYFSEGFEKMPDLWGTATLKVSVLIATAISLSAFKGGSIFKTTLVNRDKVASAIALVLLLLIFMI